MVASRKASSKGFIVTPTDSDARNFGNPVSKKVQLADAIDGQVVINLPFSIGQDVEQKKQFELVIDGKEYPESEYSFSGISNNFSSTVLLNQPLSIGQSIVVKALGYYFDKFNTASQVNAKLITDINEPHLMALSGANSFIKKNFINAVFTQILNRAKVLDDTTNLKSLSGVETIKVRSLNRLTKEVGPIGEIVYDISNKDSRVRLVGSGWIQPSDTNGNRAKTIIVNNFSEITFYGTGLSIQGPYTNSSCDIRATTDNGVEGANLIPTSLSAVLGARNYEPNIILPVVTGLALNWHTVKIRNNAVAGFDIAAFRILNARTDLAILSGEAFYGAKKETLNGLSTTAYNASVAGVRGARVVKYLKDTIISQSVTETESASAFLINTDHTNEEEYRRVNFREFGSQRGDDFSALGAGSTTRVFTLEDNLTTLFGVSIDSSSNAVRLVDDSTGMLSITFYGTGLDMLWFTDNVSTNTNANAYTVTVDGTLVGNLPQASVASELFLPTTRRLCSGLPLGTHVVKISRNVADSWTLHISDFIFYQPKKPTIPVGAIEVNDYCVNANYIESSLPDSGYIGVGVLRRQVSASESIFVGTWAQNGLDALNNAGSSVRSVTVSDYTEYRFFGTGFEWRSIVQALANNCTIAVDGVSNFTASNSPFWSGSLATSFSQVGTGAAWSATTGILSGTNPHGAANIKIKITGLNLGFHTIRFTQNGASGGLYVDSLDVICPVHSVSKTSKSFDSILDTRNFLPFKNADIDLSKVKAWVSYDGANERILSSSNIAGVLKVATGAWIVFFEKGFKSKDYVMSGSSNTQGWGFNGHLTYLRAPSMTSVSIVDTGGTFQNTPWDATFSGELEEE